TPGGPAQLGADLRGAVKSGRLKHVSASEGTARDIRREAAIRAVVASKDPRPRLSLFREPKGFEMLKLLVREAVVDLRKVDVRGRSSDLRQAVGHVGGDPGVGGPGPIPRLEARGVAGPPAAT